MWEAIILLGAPGSGKGTTAVDLTKADPRFTHVSTGNMFREELQNDTVIGRDAKVFMDKGELVPDDMVMRIVSDRLNAGPQKACYIFDGFPRTLQQARLLDAFFDHNEQGRLTDVFLLDVPRDVLVDRIAGRLICRDCGKVYHQRNMPPKVEGVCDVCGAELYQRADDNRETVLNRLEVYERQTASLVDYYDQHGVLRRVHEADREATLQAIMQQMQTHPL